MRERSISTLTYGSDIEGVMLSDGEVENPLVKGMLPSPLDPLSDRMRF